MNEIILFWFVLKVNRIEKLSNNERKQIARVGAFERVVKINYWAPNTAQMSKCMQVEMFLGANFFVHIESSLQFLLYRCEVLISIHSNNGFNMSELFFFTKPKFFIQ